MPNNGRVFRSVHEVIEEYFKELPAPPQQDFTEETDPRAAGQDLARQITESTKARVHDALAGHKTR